MMPPHTTILGKLHLYKPERAANVALTAPAPESDLTAAIVAERLGRAAPKPHSSTDKKKNDFPDQCLLAGDFFFWMRR